MSHPPPTISTSARALGALLDPRTRLTVLLTLLAAAGVVVLNVGVPEPAQVRALLGSDAVWVPLAAVLSAATLAVLLFPRAGIAILAGLLFPPESAVLYAILGTLLGASVAFGVGRVLGRPYLLKRTAATAPASRLARLQDWLERRGILAVLTVRFLPVLPFGLANYSFGATRVRFRAFVAGTGLGLLPSTVLHVLVGAHATSPFSPVFLFSAGGSLLLTAVGALVLRLRRHTIGAVEA